MRRAVRCVALLLLAGLVSVACGARLPSTLRDQAARAALYGGSGGGGTNAGGVGGGSSLGSSGGSQGGSVAGQGSLGGGASSGGGASTGTNSGGGSNTGGSSGSGPSGGSHGATTPGGHCPTSASGPGVSGKTITIGTIADETGPVNGLFDGAVQGEQSFVNYVNSTGGICGFTLKDDSADDGTNCTQNQNATSSLGSKTFALVGTFSLYDNCGEPYIAQHSVPDLHVALAGQAMDPKTHFDVEPGAGYPDGMFQYYAQTLGSKVKSVGTIVEGVPSAEEKERHIEAAAKAAGWKFVYDEPTSPTTSDWTSNFVTMCQRDHIQIFFESTENANYAAKMVNDESQAGCKGLINIIPIAYDQAFIGDVGNTSEANTVQGYNEYSLFFNTDEAARIPELKLLQGWFARTYPGQPLNLYALFAWADGRLFQYGIEHAGKTLTRDSLVAALDKVKNFTANGIVAPVTPASKTTGTSCYILWKISNGKFFRFNDPASTYRCGGTFVRS